MQDEIINMKRELLELKTAKTIPAYINMYTGTVTRAAGIYNGIYRWRIYFQDVDDTEPPIVAGAGSLFSKYDATNNTMDIFEDYTGWQATTWSTTESYQINSTRPIIRTDQLDAPAQEEWTQVRDFYPSAMGTTPGWCLQNCRKGFLIPSGTFPNAVSDMQSQRANGTLHPFNGATETPPNYIACPVYINIAGVADGHVCVWDHGTIWNDGYTVAKFTDMGGYIEVWGWGELCDGARVVQHI